MSETKWTPGPWVYGTDLKGRARVFAKDHEIVRALSTHGLRRLPNAERTANAHLIAAAPELYEALDQANDLLWKETDFSVAHPIIKKIEEALAKAKGENQ